MASTTFVDQVTVIEAEWLNEVDALVHDVFSAATTVAEVKTALSLTIGTDVQAWDAQLDDIAALAVTDGNIIVGDGANWVAESGATARTSLGVAIGSDVQAFGAVLDDLNTLGAAASDGEFIVATGAGAFAYESGATARTSLGLGSLAIQNTVNNSDWSGTDLSVANGGTGASSLTDHGVLVGSGTGAVSVTAVGSSGEVLTSNGAGADPTFQAAGGGASSLDDLSDVTITGPLQTNDVLVVIGGVFADRSPGQFKGDLKVASRADSLTNQTTSDPDDEIIIRTAGNTDKAMTLGALIDSIDIVQSETSVDATNGGADDLTEIDFTGLLAGANMIIVEFDEISLSGTNQLLVQIGDSGGMENTGYVSTALKLANNESPSSASSIAGFVVSVNEAAQILSGHMILTRITGNTWISNHGGKTLTTDTTVGGGSKTLSAELTQLRVTGSGADTFDNGNVNVKVIR